MAFVANFIRFPAVQNFGNRLRFDKVTESLKMGTFFETQCIYRPMHSGHKLTTRRICVRYVGYGDTHCASYRIGMRAFGKSSILCFFYFIVLCHSVCLGFSLVPLHYGE